MIAQSFTDGEMNIVLGNKSSSALHVSVFETERDSVHEVKVIWVYAPKSIQSPEHSDISKNAKVAHPPW